MSNSSTEAPMTQNPCYVPLIFLDVDGVFNCQIFYHSKQFQDYKEAKKTLRKSLKAKQIERMEYYSSQICRERIQWFNELCKEINAEVVVSSTWRMGKTVEQLQEIFDLVLDTEYGNSLETRRKMLRTLLPLSASPDTIGRLSKYA